MSQRKFKNNFENFSNFFQDFLKKIPKRGAGGCVPMQC